MSLTAGAAEDIKKSAVAARKDVSAYGRIEPAGGVVKVAAPYVFSAPQMLVNVAVKDGDTVREGQTLATLDSQARLLAALAKARADLGLAESQLALAETRRKSGVIEASEAELRGAQADLEHAERELKRHTEVTVRLDDPKPVAGMTNLEVEVVIGNPR